MFLCQSPVGEEEQYYRLLRRKEAEIGATSPEDYTRSGTQRAPRRKDFVLFIPETPAPGRAAAAAAAEPLQPCPTLCDPRDGSPPGSPIPGILQARTLEWVAISFSSA